MNISIDTRTLEPGDIFIPIKGENFDGHHYISDAIKKGASQILDVDIAQYAKSYRKKLNATVIAIVGSYGKTTVKDLLFSVLSTKYNVVKTKQNQNNEIGVPLTILRANYDTDFVIIELAMRKKKDLSYLTQIVRPECVVFTGVGWAHFEFFETQRELALAKSEVFRAALKSESYHRSTFINSKTDYYAMIRTKAFAKGYRVFSYDGEDGYQQNINLCYQMGRFFEVSDTQIQQSLSAFVSSDHRMVTVPVRDITVLDDTYNSNPHGVRYALACLKKFSGRKICVLGDMLELGAQTIPQHQQLASEIMDSEVDIIFALGDAMMALVAELKPHVSDHFYVRHFDSRVALNEAVVSELKADDIVLVKGSRGLQLEETVSYIQTHCG